MNENTERPAFNPFFIPSTFSEALTKGAELPEKLRDYYFGFDFEIQLSNLNEKIIDYLNTAFEQITLLVLKVKDIKNGKYDDTNTSWYEKEIKAINTEVKVIVRAYRGIDGFTIRESKTWRSEAEQRIEQKGEERQGYFKKLISGGVKK